MQSAVNARCRGDKSPNYSVVAKTMRLLINILSVYQIMDRSRHSVTRYMKDEKAHAAINKKMFKTLGHNKDQLYEVELAESDIDHG